jgi:hypothetical protein
MRSGLLEIPSQLVEDVGLERRHQLIPDNLFGPLTHVREVRRHDDPERPRRQCPEQGSVAQEEQAEFIQPGIGDDVDDHAAAGEVNADRQAVWEVPHRAGVTPAGGEVGQVRRLDPKQRCQVG